MVDHGRRFTVLWTAGSRDKRSAVMTQPEAEKFAERLRAEEVDGLRIDEGTDGPFAHIFRGK